MRAIGVESYSIYSLFDIITDETIRDEFYQVYKFEIDDFLNREKKNWSDLTTGSKRAALIWELDTFIFEKTGNSVFDIVDSLTFTTKPDEVIDWREEETHTDIDILRIEPRDKEELLQFIAKYSGKFDISLQELAEVIIEHRL